MAKTIDKLADLEYSELVTLRVIEMDEMSTSILREDLHQPFLLLYKLSKEGLLTEKDQEKIKAIFDYGICTNKLLIDKYQRIIHGVTEPIANEEVVENEGNSTDIEISVKTSVPKVSKPVVKKSADIVTDIKTPEKKVANTKKEKELPRRYEQRNDNKRYRSTGW